MAWIPQHNILCTASWDKTLKYWDTRQPNPVSVAQLPERCYALDVKQNLLVCGTAERHILVYNMQNPTQPYKQLYSPLKYQTRCIAAFPDQSGYLIGSIEGRNPCRASSCNLWKIWMAAFITSCSQLPSVSRSRRRDERDDRNADDDDRNDDGETTATTTMSAMTSRRQQH